MISPEVYLFEPIHLCQHLRNLSYGSNAKYTEAKDGTT